MYPRKLDPVSLLKQRSYFLFGPRGTGKSTLVRQSLPEARVYDLLDGGTFERLLRRPALLGEESAPDTIVVIASRGGVSSNAVRR